jgi:hypothetical protein
MIFIYEYLIFGGVLMVVVLAYVFVLIHYTGRDQRDRINAAASSSTESLLSSGVEV